MSKVPYLALLPYYDLTGRNCIEVLLESGHTQTHTVSLKKFKKQMFYSLHKDPVAIRHWIQQFLYESKYLPLLLDSQTIFLPFQMRTNVPHGDGCFGYVLARAIAKVEGSTLHLTDGSLIPTLSSPTYIQKRLIDAKVLTCAYQISPIWE